MDARTVIADRMRDLGLTVAKAARESNVTERTWRNVLIDPTAERQADTVAGMAAALRWRPDWLDRLRADLMPIATDEGGPDLTRTSVDISDLDPEQRAYVLGAVDALRKHSS